MFEGTRTRNQRRNKLVRGNAATRTSSQSSNKMRRNSTGCFNGGAKFLSFFVTVLNKAGTNPTCRERAGCPQALAGHPRALCTGFTSSTQVLVTVAVPQCWARLGTGPGAPSSCPGMRPGAQHPQQPGCALWTRKAQKRG